jgi:hypothetical protein
MASVWKQMDEIRKVCNVTVACAQKNGGFDEETVNLFDEMVQRNNLIDKIQDIQFIPGKGIPVQKREALSIRVKPKVIVLVPFVGDKEFSVGYIEVNGNSHKYTK